MLYPPVSLVTAVRVRPLSICLAVTLTPGTTAPEVSWTTPEIAAEKPCANTTPAPSAITTTIMLVSVANPVRFLPLHITPPSELRLISPESRSHREFRRSTKTVRVLTPHLGSISLVFLSRLPLDFPTRQSISDLFLAHFCGLALRQYLHGTGPFQMKT